MTLQELTKHERTIIQALRVAGHAYANDATAMHKEGMAQLEDQFVRQCAEVLQLAERLESEGISK